MVAGRRSKLRILGCAERISHDTKSVTCGLIRLAAARESEWSPHKKRQSAIGLHLLLDAKSRSHSTKMLTSWSIHCTAAQRPLRALSGGQRRRNNNNPNTG